MQALYIDSSALMALLFKQSDHINIKKIMINANELISSNLIIAECFSACTREKFDKILCWEFLQEISMVIPESKLQLELEKVFHCGYLRGANAYHLACALYLDNNTQELGFLSRDQNQCLVAQQLGFKIF